MWSRSRALDGQIPVIFGVDVEPDEHFQDPRESPPWVGFEQTVEYVRSLRPRLEAATGQSARFLWSLRMDPQVAEVYGGPTWVADAYPHLIEEILGHGDVLGVHPHASRWEGPDAGWVVDHVSQTWLDHCVASSFEAYRTCFGEPPRIHRFGAEFVNEGILATVERLGARIDLTLEPGTPPIGPGERLGATFMGWTPDYGPIPQIPYHPAPHDFRKPAQDGRLWVLPLSSGKPPPLRPPLWRRTAWHVRHPVRTMRAARQPRSRKRRQSADRGPQPALALLAMHGWSDPLAFWRSAEQLLSAGKSRYLAFAIRSDIPIRPGQRRNVTTIMDTLLERPLARRLVFTTPQDTLARLGVPP